MCTPLLLTDDAFFDLQEIYIAIVMAFLLVISTSLWLYNLLELKNEVKSEIDNVYATKCSAEKCVKLFPNYAVLFFSVVRSNLFIGPVVHILSSHTLLKQSDRRRLSKFVEQI